MSPGLCLLPDGTGYIYGAYSNDYGEHFSPPVLVSTDSPLCTNTFGIATPNGNCNENQFSDPFTGPDGALYVAYANFNNSLANSSDNHNQILLVKSTDGGATFGAPVKVGDYYDLPDCATYQGWAGRLVGPAFLKKVHNQFNLPSYQLTFWRGKPDKCQARWLLPFGSYINQDSQEPACTPAGFSPFGLNLFDGVKTAGGCKNAILLSVSNDGGATFHRHHHRSRGRSWISPDRMVRNSRTSSGNGSPSRPLANWQSLIMTASTGTMR